MKEEKLELFYPCKPYVVNQPFGNKMPIYDTFGLVGHNGIDLKAPDSWIVRAAHDGEVTFSGEEGSAGIGVVVRTLQPMEYKKSQAFFKTIYWHLKHGSVFVKANQKVKTGDILGLADNTGISTGSHLHFGLKPVYQGEQEWQWSNVEQENGYYGAIDPAPFWTGIHAQDVTAWVKLIAAVQDLSLKVKGLVFALKK